MHVKTMGILATLGASIAWAFEPVFAKLSYANADFLETFAVRAIFVALIALTYACITNFFATLLGFFILGESVTVMQISGILLLFL